MKKVFISYRHENEAHTSRVRELALRLEAVGISVVVDFLANEREFHGAGPASGWPQWLLKQAGDETQKLLVIASEGWLRSFEGTEKPGTGISFEARVIRNRIYNSNRVSPNIRVIDFGETEQTPIPDELSWYVRFAYPRDFDRLLKWLTDSEATPAPIPKDFAQDQPKQDPSTAITAVMPTKAPLAESGFLFVSYKREDLPRIQPYLKRITDWGHQVWYDRGIPGGAEWDALIEEKLTQCRMLIVFLSEAAVESKWVRREIKFADSENRPILGIRLDKKIELKHGLKLVMNQYQMIDASGADFSDELRKAIEYVRLL